MLELFVFLLFVLVPAALAASLVLCRVYSKRNKELESLVKQYQVAQARHYGDDS